MIVSWNCSLLGKNDFGNSDRYLDVWGRLCSRRGLSFAPVGITEIIPVRLFWYHDDSVFITIVRKERDHSSKNRETVCRKFGQAGTCPGLGDAQLPSK
jgi:hypothetical protein